MSTDFFLGRSSQPAAVTGDDTPNAFVNADSRDGVVAGKTSLTVPDAALQLLRGEPGWSAQFLVPAVVTYAFRSTAPSSMPSDTSGFSRFNAAQIAQAEKALQAWSDVANITFVRVGAGTTGDTAYSNKASILFGNYSAGASGSAAFGYYPGDDTYGSSSGDVWINSTLSYNANPTASNYGGMVLVHELGHAIGLAHPSDYDADGSTAITYAKNAGYYEDSRQYTVMSYFSESNTGGAFGGMYASSPLLDDIAAAQLAYGANLNTRTGDTVYGFNSTAGRDWFNATSSSTKLVFAVWDAGGADTFDFSGYTVAQTIDLRSGYFSSVGGLTGNVTIAMGATIENAIGGSAADTINGNAVDNRITGGAGNDIIDGLAGMDTAVYTGKFAGHAISATANGGWMIKDTVGTDGTDTIVNIESLVFTDRTVSIVDSRVAAAMSNVLRLTAFTTGAEAETKILAASMAAGANYTDAISQVIKATVSTSEVAVLTYQFFTGKTPTTSGMDYLIAPDGSNPTNLNSSVYNTLNVENRYINFAINLTSGGDAKASFAAAYAGLSLFDAARQTYATVFGVTPTDDKLHSILDAAVVYGGQTFTQAQVFAAIAHDDINGLGTKAALAGWLIAIGAMEDIGVYAKSADALFADQVSHDVYGVDLIGTYAKPEYNLT